jgi:hypothetical protein
MSYTTPQEFEPCSLCLREIRENTMGHMVDQRDQMLSSEPYFHFHQTFEQRRAKMGLVKVRWHAALEPVDTRKTFEDVCFCLMNDRYTEEVLRRIIASRHLGMESMAEEVAIESVMPIGRSA